MTKGVLILFSAALDLLCISSAAHEDMAGYWLNKGNDSLEEALSGSQNQTDRELILNRALQAYDEAIERDPQSALAWYKKGEILIELARFDEVLPCFSQLPRPEGRGLV